MIQFLKSRSLKIVWLILILALLIAAAILYHFTSNSKNSATTYYQGYVEGEYVYLASSQPGQLIKLLVERGQTVADGAPLFVLESQNEKDALSQANHLSEATIEQLNQAISDANRAKEQSARDAQQFQAGGISQAQLTDSKTVFLVAQKKVLELTAQQKAAEAAAAQAQWKLDQKQVSAVQGGLVFDTIYRLGEWVPAGSPVVRMLPPSNIKVRFFVPETILGSLAVADLVDLQCDGCASTVPAKIRYISDQAEYTPTNIFSNETKQKLVYMVEAYPALSDADKLRPGQPVEVSLR